MPSVGCVLMVRCQTCGSMSEVRRRRFVPVDHYNDVLARVEMLERVVGEHRAAIESAGVVRVDERDEAIAVAKHRADALLWSAVGLEDSHAPADS